MRWSRYLLIAGCLLWAGGAAGDPMKAPSLQSADDLYMACGGGEAQRRVCEGYVMGVADIMETGIVFNGYKMCIITVVKAEQLRAVLLKWLQQHPERRSYSGASVT